MNEPIINETPPATQPTIESIDRFKAGDKVEAQNDSGQWREAQIERQAPYRGREGYYVLWTLPADAPMWVSRGGWKPGYAVRPAPQWELGGPNYNQISNPDGV